MPDHLEVGVKGRSAHLTDRQLQVARLAGDGYTCKEIADELGNVTARTVKVHLAVVRRKLGVDHKRQIGRALREVGL